MKAHLQSALVCGLFTILPPVLYSWPLHAWLCFLLHLFLIAGPTSILVFRQLGTKESSARVVLACSFSMAMFSFWFAVFRWLQLPPFPSYFAAAGIGQAPAWYLATRIPHIVDKSQNAWTARERHLVFLAVLGTLLFLQSPFSSLGSDQGEYLGFSYLMLTDVFGHMAAAGEVAKGVPPMNPYFFGEVLHYYWFGHVIPGSFYELSQRAFSLFTIIQMTCAVYGVLGILLLAHWLRLVLGADNRSWIVILLVSLFAYSYIWGLPVAAWICHQLTLSFPELNLDRFFIEQGETYSGLSHGSLRDFAIEPHAVFGYCIFLALFIWRRLARHGGLHCSIHIIEGLLLGICFGTECFIGLLAILWWGASEMADCVAQGRQYSRLFARGLITAFGLASALLFILKVDMLGDASAGLALSPYLRMLLGFPVVFLLEFGAVWLMGLIGLPLMFGRENRKTYRDVIVLFLITAIFMFFVRQPYIHNLVFRKYLRIIKLPLLVASGIFLERFRAQPARPRAAPAVALCIALGIPALIADYVNLSRADGGDRSVLVDKRDAKAFTWLASNTPLTAVIQGRPDYGDKSNFSPAVVFADRRSASGDFIHARNYQIGDARVEQRALELKDVIFGKAPIDTVMSAIRRLGITHIYSGPVERAYYAEGMKKFSEHPSYFRMIYNEDSIQIFEVITE